MLASQGYHRKWSLNKYHDVSAAYGKDCISSSLLCSYSFLLLLSIYAIRGFFYISSFVQPGLEWQGAFGSGPEEPELDAALQHAELRGHGNVLL